MKDKQKAEQIATERVQLLAPLLATDLDPAKAKELRGQISADHRVPWPHALAGQGANHR